jgi:hypothetical protein
MPSVITALLCNHPHSETQAENTASIWNLSTLWQRERERGGTPPWFSRLLPGGAWSRSPPFQQPEPSHMALLAMMGQWSKSYSKLRECLIIWQERVGCSQDQWCYQLWHNSLISASGPGFQLRETPRAKQSLDPQRWDILWESWLEGCRKPMPWKEKGVVLIKRHNTMTLEWI